MRLELAEAKSDLAKQQQEVSNDDKIALGVVAYDLRQNL